MPRNALWIFKPIQSKVQTVFLATSEPKLSTPALSLDSENWSHSFLSPWTWLCTTPLPFLAWLYFSRSLLSRQRSSNTSVENINRQVVPWESLNPLPQNSCLAISTNSGLLCRDPYAILTSSWLWETRLQVLFLNKWLPRLPPSEILSNGRKMTFSLRMEVTNSALSYWQIVFVMSGEPALGKPL